MESCRWPATLKEEKRPLATQNPYFHSGDGNAAETDIEIRPMSVADRPQAGTGQVRGIDRKRTPIVADAASAKRTNQRTP
jgi:hypothetical protein